MKTYSVIIQNQKTMEEFGRFRPLYAESLNENRIGVCKWNEAGTTIDTALPELRSLTDDKENWRAIIVRYIDETPMRTYESVRGNPYDFIVNADYNGEVQENAVPLIRLTQMLGGIPPLNLSFRTEVVREPHRAPRTIYVPIVDEEQNKLHDLLAEKYHFYGKAPSSIIIVSVRKKSDSPDTRFGREWKSHRESESSEFWKRNQYPSVCRFLVYDYLSEGPVQKEADDFNFWYSVLLLSLNEIDSSTLQAYRLYTVRCIMNKQAMTDSCQQYANRLRDSKIFLHSKIVGEKAAFSDDEDLPDYQITIPIALNLPRIKKREVNLSVFGLLSDGANNDLAIFDNQQRHVQNELARSVKIANRSLDKAAARANENCTYDEDEVNPLNQYQEEDLQEGLNDLYKQIVNLQGVLPNESLLSNPAVGHAEQTVRKSLLSRILKKPAIMTLVFTTLLLAAAAIPAMISAAQNSQPLHILYIVLGEIAVVGTASLIVMLFQSTSLKRALRAYNQAVKNTFKELVDNTDDYSKFVSAIISHERGASYYRISKMKKEKYSTDGNALHKHIKTVNALLAKLKKWSIAYHLDVDFEAPRPNEPLVIDTTVQPHRTPAYYCDYGMRYPVPLNHSGNSVESPFNYATSIEINREELYDERH